MTYEMATRILSRQHKSLRAIRDVRVFRGGYEYRVDYWGGFGAYIAIDRRVMGKRKFQFFGGASGAHCRDAEEAMGLVMDKIEGRA